MHKSRSVSILLLAVWKSGIRAKCLARENCRVFHLPQRWARILTTESARDGSRSYKVTLADRRDIFVSFIATWFMVRSFCPVGTGWPIKVSPLWSIRGFHNFWCYSSMEIFILISRIFISSLDLLSGMSSRSAGLEHLTSIGSPRFLCTRVLTFPCPCIQKQLVLEMCTTHGPQPRPPSFLKIKIYRYVRSVLHTRSHNLDMRTAVPAVIL
jgi:hypothetical protein